MRRLLLITTVIALILSVGSYKQVSIAQVEGVTVVDGLNGPMGVLLDETGTLWVIEAGTGGDTDIPFVNAQSGEPITANSGETAQVLTIDPDGARHVVTALPSVATGAEVIGGARLATLDGKVYATLGQWLGDPTAEAGLPNMGVVAEISEGSARAVASTWDFERRENPDGLMTDSHPYGLTADPAGVLWVADAGGNALLSVDPATGEVRLAAVFAGVPSPLPSPARNQELLTDPVPTAVVAQDGLLFVSLLPGFPFTPGSAKVVTVDGAGKVSDYATNLTMLTDLRLGPDNELYAIQFAEYNETGPTPNSGALVRVVEGDRSEVVLSGLSFPTSVAFNAEGDAYIAINGVGAPGSGQVVRYAAIAAPGAVDATSAMTETAALTDTVAMTDTMTMTDTMAMTDTADIADAAVMTVTASVTESTAMTDTVADVMSEPVRDTITDTGAMTDTAVMTATTLEAPVVKAADPAGAIREDVQAREPETMPVTGIGSADALQTTVPVVLLILSALAASAVVTRRRTA
ncbi:MAG: ScyD/ScyE family protein [Caldilineaceae bacterium]